MEVPIYHNPEVDEKFADYLKGKSVAFVGRSEYMKTLEQGELIDSYDVVVRIHNVMPYNSAATAERLQREQPNMLEMFAYSYSDWSWYGGFVPPEWHKYLGARANIFYFGRTYGIKPGQLQWFKQMLDSFWKAGGKFVASDLPTNWNHTGKDESPGFLNEEARELVWDFFRGVTLDDPHYLKLKEVTQSKEGTTFSGMSALLDILKHGVTSVYVTGMGCFLDMPKPPVHIPVDLCMRNLEYLNKIVNARNITVDPIMKEIFDSHGL